MPAPQPRLEIRNCYHKPIPGHPVFMPVHMFIKPQAIALQDMDNVIQPKQYMTLPYINETLKQSDNVLVSCANPIISAYISKETNTMLDSQPVTVAKHLGEVLQTDVVVLINMFCDIKTKNHMWDIFYYSAPGTTPQRGRVFLLEDDL